MTPIQLLEDTARPSTAERPNYHEQRHSVADGSLLARVRRLLGNALVFSFLCAVCVDGAPEPVLGRRNSPVSGRAEL